MPIIRQPPTNFLTITITIPHKHRLELREIVQPVHRQLPPHTGLLPSSDGHVQCADGHGAVDPDGAGFESFRDADGAGEGLGVY